MTLSQRLASFGCFATSDDYTDPIADSNLDASYDTDDLLDYDDSYDLVADSNI
jgi:hypothetical protein